MKSFIQAATCAALFPLSLISNELFASSPNTHAPIGVMGDHTHKQGELMFSYRFMHMDMKGNRSGSSKQSPESITTSAANRFFGTPMQPPTLRVVPTKMTMDMHMLGLMYAPNDRVTLMGMANYIKKEMEHVTFAGPTGNNRLGSFTTKTNGIGDTHFSALISLTPLAPQWHITAGISLPTGDIKQRGTILTPMNTTPSPRLPYPMQLGSGTYDLITGLTYAANHDIWAWGSQWRSVVRTGENSEDYTLGDEHKITGWLSYTLNHSISFSTRLEFYKRSNIDGIDSMIAAPVQTADPSRQGAERWDLTVGANWLLPEHKHRLAFEIGTPIYQHLNGPQLETDLQVTFGWQYTP